MKRPKIKRRDPADVRDEQRVEFQRALAILWQEQQRLGGDCDVSLELSRHGEVLVSASRWVNGRRFVRAFYYHRADCEKMSLRDVIHSLLRAPEIQRGFISEEHLDALLKMAKGEVGK